MIKISNSEIHEMSSYRVKKDIGFNDIEVMADILSKGDVDEVFIPNSLKNAGLLGVEGFLIQVLVGWYRSGGKRSTRLYLENGFVNDDLKNLLLQAVLGLSDTVSTISGHVVDKKLALDVLAFKLGELKKLKFKESFKGPYLALSSIKTEMSDLEFVSPFYGLDDLVGGNDFEKLTNLALEKALLGIKGRMDKINPVRVSNISNIIYELFSNTHKHARNHVNGDVIRRNVRGVVFNGNKISKSRINQVADESSFKLKMLSDDWFSSMSKESMHVLEITVVDGGPGYARRWLKKDALSISKEEEVAAILECFQKHNSSSPYASSGSGLTTVMRSLRSLHGWFRLRTGSMVVERSFANGEGELFISKKDISDAGVFLEGAVFSVVVPLG